MTDSVELADLPTGTKVALWNEAFEPIGTIDADGIKEKPADATETFTWSHTPTDLYTETFTFTVPGDNFGAVGVSLDNGSRVAKPHECPHCFRQKHPEPLTQRMAAMYDTHKFDPAYDGAADDSGVVCIGADYYGPVTVDADHRSGTYWGGNTQPWVVFDEAADEVAKKAHKALEGMSNLIAELCGPWSMTVSSSTWLPDDPYLPVGPAAIECNKLLIKYNDPDNWKPWEKPWYPVSPALDIKWEQWHSSFPAPEAPGYDFTAFIQPEVKYPNRKKKTHETI